MKADSIKKLSGTLREDRKKLDNENCQILDIVPEAESFLSTNAKMYFKKFCSFLIDQKKLYAEDIHLINFLSEEMATYEKANKNLKKKNAFIMTTPKGYQQQSPWVSIRNQSLKNIKDLGSLFGFDPLSRTKLPVNKDEKEDELSKLFNKYN